MPIGDPSYCYECGRLCPVSGEVELTDERTGKLIIKLEYALCRWHKAAETRRQRKTGGENEK